MVAATHVCGLCGSTEASIYLDRTVDYITSEEFHVRQCGHCGLAATAPEPSSMDAYYPATYRSYSGATLRTLRLLYDRKVRGWMRRLPRRGRALEVGCGAG